MFVLKLIILFLILFLIYNFRRYEKFNSNNINEFIHLTVLDNNDTLTLYWHFTSNDNIKIKYFKIKIDNIVDSNISFNDNIKYYNKKIFLQDKIDKTIQIEGYNENDKIVTNSNKITLGEKKKLNYNKIEHKIQCLPDGDYNVGIDCVNMNKFPDIENVLSDSLKKLKKIVNTVLKKNIIIK